MCIRNFEGLREYVKNSSPKTVAVASAHDSHTLEAVLQAYDEGILDYVLTGKEEKILKCGENLGYKIPREKIIPCSTDEEAAAICVRLVREKKADFIQKGLMQTSVLLKAVVNKESGIGTGRKISHTALLDIPQYGKIAGVTDGGMILYPDLETKKSIVENAVEMFHQFGYERPMVAAVCPVEVVNPKMPETVDAEALKSLALNGGFGECYVEGPISFDLAVDKKSAEIKGYESPVTGNTDIFLVPDISAGNIMVKSLLEFAGARMAGCVIGAKCPIALNSRSAAFEEKYYSLLACAHMA